MSFKRITALLAAVLLLAGVCAASGAAGDAENPLLSQGYMDGPFTQSVLSDASKAIRFTLSKEIEEMKAEAGGPKSTGSYAVKSVPAGSTAKLDLGDSLILLSGEANVVVERGALVNVSVGAAAASGALLKNNRYLACEDCAATVTFTADSQFAADGSVAVSGNVSPFTDVLPKHWFYSDVVAAVQRGLVNGMTPTTYEPQGSLTGAQCVKLAACLHQLYYSGSVTLGDSAAGPWYRDYLDYALQNGILEEELSNYNIPLDRRSFVRLFFRAMPESAYPAINTVADNAIPDVKMGDAEAHAIYVFYRAGVLTGYSDSTQFEDFAFGPGNSISRAEVATIMNRMVDASARQHFSLG